MEVGPAFEFRIQDVKVLALAVGEEGAVMVQEYNVDRLVESLKAGDSAVRCKSE